MKMHDSRLPPLPTGDFAHSEIQSVFRSLAKSPVNKVVRHSGCIAIIAHFMNSPGQEPARQNLAYCESAGLSPFQRSFSSRRNNYASQMNTKTDSNRHSLATATSTAQTPSSLLVPCNGIFGRTCMIDNRNPQLIQRQPFIVFTTLLTPLRILNMFHPRSENKQQADGLFSQKFANPVNLFFIPDPFFSAK